MSKAGVLVWRMLFETGDKRRLAKQVQDLSDLAITRDIPYIDDGERGHLFDIYRLPDAPADAPVVVNIHGGGLFASYKEVNANFNYEWARMGYTVVSISYRRIPETTLWHQVDDVMAALRFLAIHAGELGIEMGSEQGSVRGGSQGGDRGASGCFDQGQCFLTGDSAGALLALFALALEGSGELREAFGIAASGLSFRAAGLISIMLDTQRADALRSLNDVVTCDDDRGRPYERFLLDPGAMVERADLPPLFLVTSEEDLIRGDTLKFQSLVESAHVTYELADYPRGGERELVHVFSVGYPNYPESRDVLNRMDAFFKSNVQKHGRNLV